MRSLPRLSRAFPLHLLGANRPVPKVNIAGMPHCAFITPVRANADQNRGPRGAGALTILSARHPDARLYVAPVLGSMQSERCAVAISSK
jgi:hypothetical protein